MKRTFAVVLGLTGVVTAALAFRKDDPGYKNLKVLPKEITAHQLDSVMEHFSNALGVSCDFCHVKEVMGSSETWDFASDDKKHKLVARQMLEMTYAINDRYFDYTGSKRTLDTQLMITCFSCHNGQTMPETIPPEKDKD